MSTLSFRDLTFGQMLEAKCQNKTGHTESLPLAANAKQNKWAESFFDVPAKFESKNKNNIFVLNKIR
jgi:hypothetical protein